METLKIIPYLSLVQGLGDFSSSLRSSLCEAAVLSKFQLKIYDRA
jgi:hypothetical protein